MEKVNILGVDVNNISLPEAIQTVLVWLKGNGKHYIVTPNPEFILAAQKDPEFKKVLNSADLAIPDGSRLGWAAKMIQEKNFIKRFLLFPFFLFPANVVIQFETVAGVDLMDALCKTCADYGFTTGFLGGQNGVAAKAADCLQKKYPKLKVVFAGDGGEVDTDGNVIARSPDNNRTTRQSATNLEDRHASLAMTEKVDILFVAFGQVKQEKWIAKNLDKLPVKVAMGVGGAFDYLSGNIQRAPAWMRSIRLEWLFRLILQPWRIKRQLRLLNFIILLLRGTK